MMRRAWKKRRRSGLLPIITLSALVHVSILLPLRGPLKRYLASREARPAVRVVTLSPEQWSKNFQTRAQPPGQRPHLSESRTAARNEAPRPTAPEPPKSPEPPKKEQKDRLDRQIVEVPPTADDSPNNDAKYYSKYNAHVNKETIARMDARDSRMKRVTNELQSRDSKPAAPSIRTPNLSVKGDNRPDDSAGKAAEKRMILKVPDILKREDLDLKLLPGPGPGIAPHNGSEALKGNSDKLELQLGKSDHEMPGEDAGKKGEQNGSEQRPLPTLSALVPQLGAASRLSGSPSRDAVDGVQEGDGTFLNTKEFKYATFFYRVRDSVADYWEDLAALEYRRRDPTGHIYGIRDRATLLRIQLSKSGELDDIRVEQSSGVEFLDNVAVQAFRKAQPFPNPPMGIADEDGHIRFNFQFIITMHPERGISVFR